MREQDGLPQALAEDSPKLGLTVQTPTAVPIEGTDITRIVIGADRFDVYNAPALRELTVDLVRTLRYRQVLDLDGVRDADSTGLGVMVGADKRALAHGGALVLVNVGVGLAHTLRITGLDRYFTIACDLASAVAFFNIPFPLVRRVSSTILSDYGV